MILVGGQDPAKFKIDAGCVALHPKFKSFHQPRSLSEPGYDFGVIVLAQKLMFGNAVQPICLEKDQKFELSKLEDVAISNGPEGVKNQPDGEKQAGTLEILDDLNGQGGQEGKLCAPVDEQKTKAFNYGYGSGGKVPKSWAYT